ncbi:LysR family transcriptional regulator [Levilactobacillus tujiorum]|uniref:LysR family transcriptional regulator n=1 Tax=Levilactobacillus tujiorum TaxID=2912243 RepID=A0ABX1L743_9LACO|nr:LysR family transcriptional regulator [Levilactobacillus tujiorum]MCH5465503.1 LysR family transcriptional regulator [Levilactobacillus tujiorum]NLR12589.1 LysR family transcriptional regulator [Lactobacillus sp. HBUAS51387]NLR29792.1 LysR family transcriptional regulator [Levilactobacillus tujiorum]
MELRVLRYFLMIVQEKNISKASARLHVSQPTVSRQLKELEEELGTTLFERGNRTIQLTSDGAYFANQARQILSLTDKTLANIHQEKDISGSVYVGSAEARSMLTVAQALGQLNQRHPHIQVNLVSTDAAEVHQRLTSGVFDFGVVMEPIDKSDYDFLRLPGESRWGLLVQSSSPLAQQATISLEDVAKSRLILPQQGGSARIHDLFGLTQSELNVVATYNLLYNASLLVSAGVGNALGLDGIINTNQSDLTFVPLTPRTSSGSSLVWLKGQRLSVAAQALLTQVQAELAPLEG